MVALHEAEMLDISILSADKVLTNEEKKREFLDSHCNITAKTDGVKLTILKIANNGNLSDWIFAYKGHILYPGEFDWQPEAEITAKSVGASQFQKVFDHFNKLKKNDIPVGTELQCEFLMRKNTLSSNYKKPHGIILIQYTKSEYNEKAARYGVLKTKQLQDGNVEKREKYAKILGINTPLVLFDGILGNRNSFVKGIKYPELKVQYDKVADSLNFDNTDEIYSQLKQLFLNVESQFGGKEEGVVITMDNGDIYKWQQSYQLDQVARKAIKAKTREDSEEAEDEYWEKVKKTAVGVCEDISNVLPLKDALGLLSKKMKDLRVKFAHSKKSESQIKDDIQLTAKTLIIKRMKGNNGCLVLGKFRILTNGHKKVIDSALNEFDNVCICLVTSKETANTFEMRLSALKKVFGKNNRIEIITTRTGNIIRTFEKASFNINAVYTGTDRVQQYVDQIGKSIGMSVKEIKRTSGDISATKVIENIKNKEYFLKNTPEEIHSMYDEYVKIYG